MTSSGLLFMKPKGSWNVIIWIECWRVRASCYEFSLPRSSNIWISVRFRTSGMIIFFFTETVGRFYLFDVNLVLEHELVTLHCGEMFISAKSSHWRRRNLIYTMHLHGNILEKGICVKICISNLEINQNFQGICHKWQKFTEVMVCVIQVIVKSPKMAGEE